MKKYTLGKTGIKVSELCFGALTLGPIQADISVEKGAKVIRAALEKGIIRAIGISTHVVGIVEKVAEIEEIDIIFPIINKIGLGIIGGSTSDMIKAISKAGKAGKGLYAMKALGGGRLIGELESSINFVRNIADINSIAVGMISENELELNIKIFNNEEISQEIINKRIKPNKKLFISSFCIGCGTCVKTCPNEALSLIDGKAVVNHDLCILYGYCNPVCPVFAIRIL